MDLEEKKKFQIDELIDLFAGGRRHYLLMLRDDVNALATRAFELGVIAERERASGQEHGRCPFGLEYPLQDVKVCRDLDCKHYKRKYSQRPERCLWRGWPKDDVLVEPPPTEEVTPVTEVEETKVILDPPEPEEPVEEATEKEYDEFVMLYCESGGHDAGIVSHGKKNIEPGWAEYTCLECKKVTPMLISKAEEEPPF